VVKDKLGAVLGKLTHQHSDIDSVNVFLIAMKDNDNDEWDTEHKGSSISLDLKKAEKVEYYEANEEFFDKFFGVLF